MEKIEKNNFIDVNCKKETLDKYIEKLTDGKISELTITNIISSTFCEIYDIEAEDFNGWQCDWWASLYINNKCISVFGYAWEGYINLSIEGYEYEDDEEDIQDDGVDVYHDIDIVVRGIKRRNVIPVKDNASIEDAEKDVKAGKFQKFYVWRTTTDSYSLLYAPDVNSGVTRLLAIWDDYNDIADERQFKEKCKYYENRYSDRIKFSGNYYILDMSKVVELSEEETREYMKYMENYPRDINRKRTDELEEAYYKWKEDNFPGKAIILNKNVF